MAAAVLYFGYNGAGREKLEAELLKSADITLDMQSVSGEILFGGRSSQFLHNETHYAALCEFYASFFKKRGDLIKAGQFKSAARLAVEHISPWLNDDILHHVKNYFPIDSKFGCEGYGHYNKYMITAGSWLYMAYIFADDSIDEVDCPAISKNGVFETSEYFHKTVCRYNDYFVEFDTKADPHYDASGIGRVQKRGVPSALCLSVPFSENPNYTIDIKNPSGFSICVGIKEKDDFSYTYDESAVYKMIDKKVDEKYVSVKFECVTASGMKIFQTCILSDDGVEISAEGNGEVKILFPVFDFDGANKTNILISEKSIDVSYKKSKCVYSTDGIFEDMNKLYANRNGYYKAMSASGSEKVILKIKMI